jgi:hypothetical protein
MWLGWSLAACLDPTGEKDVGGEHLWVFHVSGGSYADHVQLAAIGDRTDAGGRRRFRAIPSRAWDGSPTNDFAHLEVLATDTAGKQWRMEGADGSILRLEFQTTGDSSSGTLAILGGATYGVFGVRFDSSVVGLLAPRLPPVVDDSIPEILIRLDDASATDADFLGRLSMRGLPAEIAVPTRLVGLPGRLTWNELRGWRARGMGIAMHSREHRRTSADSQYFVAEIVGGFAELAAQGLSTRVFVEPGTWGGAVSFDAPQKLHTWRGALLRSFATVSECYAYPRAFSFVVADSFALGLSHATISDGLSESQIRALWQGALLPRLATVFLVHTARLKSPGQLDWFLDLVAGAAASGKIRVVTDAEQLFLPRSHAALLVP